MNSNIKLLSTTSTLTKRYLSIYKQMQITDWVKKKIKLFTIVQITIYIFLRSASNFSKAHTISNNNTFFLYLFNTVWRTITPIPQNLDAKISKLMKKRKCFNCKRRWYTILNCLEKAKIFAIINISDMNDIVNIDLEKE